MSADVPSSRACAACLSPMLSLHARCDIERNLCRCAIQPRMCGMPVAHAEPTRSLRHRTQCLQTCHPAAHV
eukprot:105624-Chlamydomonas_euryale.AAC.1